MHAEAAGLTAFILQAIRTLAENDVEQFAT